MSLCVSACLWLIKCSVWLFVRWVVSSFHSKRLILFIHYLIKIIKELTKVIKQIYISLPLPSLIIVCFTSYHANKGLKEVHFLAPWFMLKETKNCLLQLPECLVFALRLLHQLTLDKLQSLVYRSYNLVIWYSEEVWLLRCLTLKSISLTDVSNQPKSTLNVLFFSNIIISYLPHVTYLMRNVQSQPTSQNCPKHSRLGLFLLSNLFCRNCPAPHTQTDLQHSPFCSGCPFFAGFCMISGSYSRKEDAALCYFRAFCKYPRHTIGTQNSGPLSLDGYCVLRRAAAHRSDVSLSAQKETFVLRLGPFLGADRCAPTQAVCCVWQWNPLVHLHG